MKPFPGDIFEGIIDFSLVGAHWIFPLNIMQSKIDDQLIFFEKKNIRKISY